MEFEMLQMWKSGFCTESTSRGYSKVGRCGGAGTWAGGSRGCLKTMERESEHGAGRVLPKGWQNNMRQIKRLVNWTFPSQYFAGRKSSLPDTGKPSLGT